ncbi:glycine zipper 2TM domain-containing protein [Pararhodobacter sp. CCB-MM2]|uniref:glycine zipper 2TM domain-containing protein n=1 Tax=Pararhodobacter sp. CCB-MM2 TaxID=1786003 RepID=UPI0008345F90|nr:glycine zipper 2TM domain-containing protein [Pararhodobacter sp. CCB-MM2]MCA2009870.1 glycine zipper 2TM domain-containing protein [Cereibacter sphaeroides]
MKSMILATAAVATLGLGACTMSANERTAVGGLAGAAGGLILADALNANPNWTIVAALGGAAAGALVARNSASGQCAYSNGNGSYYTGPCV